MFVRSVAAAIAVVFTVVVPVLSQQAPPFDRLPPRVFDVTPPASRVTGDPGNMSIRPVACRSLPLPQARQRIIDLAAQEWAYFGFPIVEYDEDDEAPDVVVGRGGGGTGQGGNGGRRRAPSRIGTPEAARTAASIGGYWAVTPGGGWILESQNAQWRDAISGVTRWRFPWSAAFISWLMCEGGIASADAFQRAIAHHTYIDQAIRARDGRAPTAVYVAHDVGEASIVPGDMLCSSRQPVFRTIAARRAQLGQGARTHCDVVVKVDERAGQILAIGGNVRGVVGLKVFPATLRDGQLRLAMPASTTATRPMFAHLRLRGTPRPADAIGSSPTVRAIACGSSRQVTGPPALRQLLTSVANCAD